MTGKLLARQRLEAYIAQLREHTDDQKLRDRIAEVEAQTKKPIRETLSKELSEATAWLSATPRATVEAFGRCDLRGRMCGRMDRMQVREAIRGQYGECGCAGAWRNGPVTGHIPCDCIQLGTVAEVC